MGLFSRLSPATASGWPRLSQGLCSGGSLGPLQPGCRVLLLGSSTRGLAVPPGLALEQSPTGLPLLLLTLCVCGALFHGRCCWAAHPCLCTGSSSSPATQGWRGCGWMAGKEGGRQRASLACRRCQAQVAENCCRRPRSECVPLGHTQNCCTPCLQPFENTRHVF